MISPSIFQRSSKLFCTLCKNFAKRRPSDKFFYTMQIFLSLLVFLLCGFTSYKGVHYTLLNDSVHLFEIDPTKVAILPERALNRRETVLSIATRKQALCAFNGGFFAHDGTPRCILKIKGEWIAFPTKQRGAVGWKTNGEVVIFGRVLADQEGSEWEKMEHIVGGAPLLIHKGTKINDYSVEQIRDSFLYEKHARTAVGLLSNGNWLFVVVEENPGITIPELAVMMEELDCQEGLNLDGGSSSTCVYKGKVINHPKKEVAVSDAILIVEYR